MSTNTNTNDDGTDDEESGDPLEEAQATPFRGYDMDRIAGALSEVAEDARDLAQDFGLKPYPVNYWIVSNDEMNQLIAYGGFQTRYPHWRWGMKYDKQRKQSQFGGGKAFEIVNNDNPSHAFLQASNSMADQKAVITHVEAHADFFANNKWFSDDPNAAAMLERHARKIKSYMEDPDIGRDEVEQWIDHILCLEDNIDQYAQVTAEDDTPPAEDDEVADIREQVESLDLSDDVRAEIFDEEWLESQEEDSEESTEEEDLLAFLMRHGKQYDEDEERATEYESWQLDILKMLRKEAYYFAPQKMTKVMNEGWAAYWESMMMGDAGFADDDEIFTYADHQSAVLNSPGFNPYKLGKALWDYIENTVNRREVVDKLLRVDGVTPRNFHDRIDFAEVQDLLTHPDSDELAKRHYSLAKPQNRGFIQNITRSELETMARYLFDDSRYDSVEEALADVDYEAGWNRMYEVRESHNDITFIDSFLTDEFVKQEGYFAYEYDHRSDDMRVSSTAAEDVKKKLLLQFTNFGKPTIVAVDANHNNSGELLLEHKYNGVMLDLDQAHKVLKRMFELWGRPVNLHTIVKTSDDGTEEEGRCLRYNGEEYEVRDLDWEEVEHLAADDIDYDTKPDEWI